jgi:hypothetical protein
MVHHCAAGDHHPLRPREVAPRTRPSSGSAAGSRVRRSSRNPSPGALDHSGGLGGAPQAEARARRSPARRRGAHLRRETRHAGGVSDASGWRATLRCRSISATAGSLALQNISPALPGPCGSCVIRGERRHQGGGAECLLPATLLGGEGPRARAPPPSRGGEGSADAAGISWVNTGVAWPRRTHRVHRTPARTSQTSSTFEVEGRRATRLSTLMTHTLDLVCEYERAPSADSARKLAKWAIQRVGFMTAGPYPERRGGPWPVTARPRLRPGAG